MATVGSDYKTLIDLATDADKVQMVEILQRKNPLISMLPWIPCNDGTGHKTKIRTGYPEPEFRRLYGFVQPTAGTMIPVREATGFIEDYSEVDYEEYLLQGDDKDVWLMHEDFAHIEGMSDRAETALWYGNSSTNPEEFNGLTPRYSSLSTAVSATAENVIDGGGAGSDNTSIWLLGLSPRSLCGIYPQGTQAGLRNENLGKQTSQGTAPSGKPGLMEVVRSHYVWHLGMSLTDWRHTSRIPNIDVSDLRTTVADMQALITLMIRASEVVEDDPPGGQKVFCCNKTIRTHLRIGINEKIANNLTWETVEGKKVMMFDEIPVVRTDALLNTEAAVT